MRNSPNHKTVSQSAILIKKLLSFAFFIMFLLEAYAWDSGAVLASCGDDNIPPGSSYFNNLQHVLADIEKQTSLTRDYTYQTQHSEGGTTAYGLGSCVRSLEANVCSDCLKFLVDNLWKYCGSSIVATLQMPKDCTLQFQDTNF